ncbi:MAG: HAMP domain-containing sensor histidine kinase [bacterium]
MFLDRIQNRFVFFFVLLVIVILIVSGWTLQWMIRRSLEAELGRKLVAVAQAASVQLEEEDIGFLIQGMGPRIQERMQQRLLRLQKSTDVKRIYFFDMSGNSLLDTEEHTERGDAYFNLQFYRREIEDIRNQKSSYSILFTGIDGRPTMTGFAPLYNAGQVIGGIGVDGSVTFLEAVNKLQNRLYLIGAAGTFAAIVISLTLAGSITRPIGKLVKASKKIGRGDYSESIPPLAKGEIGLLAKTMEEMRKGVVEREKDLKAMLAGVAHEIRNPLGGIQLFTDLLADEVSKDKDAQKHIDRISKEIGHLKEIIDSFLTYARPQEPDKKICPLKETIAEAGLLMENHFKERGITLWTPEDADEGHVWADPNHLKRIVLNLLHNAAQAMPDGGEIKIGWKGSGDSIDLSFRDSGRGIPEELHEKIFTPFFTTHEKGTGLGLTIVKSLVEANGGAIRLVRSDANGTEFEITFISKSEMRSRKQIPMTRI